ncbi:MAG: hypothetical protein ACJ735_04160 [Actinomycetes bacterium]
MPYSFDQLELFLYDERREQLGAMLRAGVPVSEIRRRLVSSPTLARCPAPLESIPLRSVDNSEASQSEDEPQEPLRVFTTAAGRQPRQSAELYQRMNGWWCGISAGAQSEKLNPDPPWSNR